MPSLVIGTKSKKPARSRKKKISAALKKISNEHIPVSREKTEDLASRDKGSLVARKALERSEKSFRALAEHAPDIIARFDKDFRHLYVNRQAEKVLGISRENIIGRTHSELGYPDYLVDLWQKKIVDVFLKKEKMTIEFAVLVHSGDRYFESSLVPELNEQGEVESVLALTRDITHFKETEKRISDLNTRLKAQAKDLENINQELESFTYAVSHDLRAPIRSIKGFTEAIQQDFLSELPDKAKDYLRRANRAAHKMSQLIDSLLELSREGRKEVQTGRVNLSSLARDFLAELRNSQPERKSEFVIEEGLEVRGDSRLLEIALQNLLRNAWKFTMGRSPARIEFGVKNEKDKRIFFVRDNGVGFDMSYAGKLFVPFQRLHSASEFPGAGVGLSTVKRIMRKHNGRIWAESQEGKGATFYFSIGAEENDDGGR